MDLSEDIPSASTPCIVCRNLGHWCPAYRYVGSTDEGICRPCLEMRNCPQSLAHLNDEEEGGKVLTDDIRKEVLAAPLNESDVSIGLRIGISPQYVGRIRRKYGIVPVKEKCAIDGCEHGAQLGFRYCSTRHNRELEIEKYDRIVAARKAQRKYPEKPKTKLPKPIPMADLIQEDVMEKSGLTKMDEVIVEEPSVPLQPVGEDRGAYDVVIDDVEAQILALQSVVVSLKALRSKK